MRFYIPHIKAAFLPRNLPLASKLSLFLGTMQTVKKLVYAFLFQEETFDTDFLTSPTANSVGAFLQSSVNTKLGLPTALPNLGGNLHGGLGLYPGDVWCRASQPHSLWHAQSAAGLVDFILLVDTMVKIVFYP